MKDSKGARVARATLAQPVQMEIRVCLGRQARRDPRAPKARLAAREILVHWERQDRLASLVRWEKEATLVRPALLA